MESFAPPSWLITLTWSLSLVVGCVRAYFWLASASTPRKKLREPPQPIPPSALAGLQADQAELFSTLEKLTTTVKRLSSRAAMRERREGEAEGSHPPIGTNKADLLRHYGMSGKVGPAFAQAQLDIERRTN